MVITTSAHQAFSSLLALIHHSETTQLSRIGSKITSPPCGVFSLSTWFLMICMTYACLCSRTRLPTKKRGRGRLKSLSRSKAALEEGKGTQAEFRIHRYGLDRALNLHLILAHSSPRGEDLTITRWGRRQAWVFLVVQPGQMHFIISSPRTERAICGILTTTNPLRKGPYLSCRIAL